MKTTGLIAIAMLAGLCYLAWLFGAFDLFRLWQVSAEVPFNPAECNRIVALIAAKKIVPDATGRVVLPANLASATKFGDVYVTRKKGGLLLVLFPTWRGKGSNLVGYLFTSRPLTKTDTHTEFYTGRDQAIEAIGPQLGALGKQAGPFEVTLERSIKPQWYYVSYSLD